MRPSSLKVLLARALAARGAHATAHIMSIECVEIPWTTRRTIAATATDALRTGSVNCGRDGGGRGGRLRPLDPADHPHPRDGVTPIVGTRTFVRAYDNVSPVLERHYKSTRFTGTGIHGPPARLLQPSKCTRVRLLVPTRALPPRPTTVAVGRRRLYTQQGPPTAFQTNFNRIVSYQTTHLYSSPQEYTS